MQAPKLSSERTGFHSPDLIQPLPNTQHSELGTCVVSAETKLWGSPEGVVVAHYVVTGLVPRGDWEFSELRPLLIGQHAIGQLDWRKPAIKEHEELNTYWTDGLGQIESLALTSRPAGGLRYVPYPVAETGRAALSQSGEAIPHRERIQLGRFFMAHLHLTMHMSTDAAIWESRIRLGATMGFTETELFIGELYSLARGFGVKEILPKIREYMGQEALQVTESSDEKIALTKLASLVVKLKRRGMMSK